MTVETKDVKVKAKKKTKKNKVVAPIVKVSGNKGKLSYKKVSGNSKFTVSAKTGKVTVKKGTKKGNYKVKIKVAAGATKVYKATSMTVTVKIKVGK
jgi:endo-1,4-beta-xylanase